MAIQLVWLSVSAQAIYVISTYCKVLTKKGIGRHNVMSLLHTVDLYTLLRVQIKDVPAWTADRKF